MTIEWPAGALVLTGQRVGEVAGMAWNEVDMSSGLWTLPTSRTKAAREHLVRWRRKMAIVRAAPYIGNSPLMFQSRSRRPIASLPKAKLDELSGVLAWRVHDLRRACATNLARLGFPPHAVGAVLNHAPGGVTAVYNRWAYLPEKKAALEAWATDISPNMTNI